MSDNTHDITINSKTDKLELLTHVVSHILSENGGELQLQQARSQALEKIQSVDESTKEELDEEEFTDLVTSNNAFSLREDQFGQDIITSVSKVGSRPKWLEIKTPDDESSRDTDKFDINGLNNTTSSAADDFSEIDCLSDIERDALKDTGFTTFNELANAAIEEITDTPGIKQALAKEVKEQAQQNLDPIEEIAKEAYRDEQSEETTSTDSESRDNGETDAHMLTDITISPGDPRGPEYEGTNEPRHINGLPVLEYPTANQSILTDFLEGAESLQEFLYEVAPFIKYEQQLSGFKNAINNAGDFDDIVAAVETGNDLLTDILHQPGCTVAQIKDAVEAHADAVRANGFSTNVILDIDLELEDEAPVKSRLAVMEAMEAKQEAVSDTETLLEEATYKDLQQSSEAPIELDHPFIEDIDEYPVLKTRELENGELDIEVAPRIIAKNNYALDLKGHAGVGKDTLIKVIAAATNRPIVTVNMDESMISQDMLGIHQIDENGKVIFKDGVIPHTAKNGFMLMISEVNAAAPEIQMAFHQLLERDSKLHVKEKDEIITPSPKFRIVTTRNPATNEYDGAKEMNGAFERRLNSIWLPYLNRDDEVELIDEMVNSDRRKIDREGIETLVDIVRDFRDNADESFSYPRLSTSKLLHIIDLYDGSDNLLGTTKMSIKPEIGEMHQEEACMNTIEDHFNN